MSNYIRLKTYSIEEVEKALKPAVLATLESHQPFDVKLPVRINFDGLNLKIRSQRYQLFLSQETTCVCCGMKATHYASERFRSDKKGPAHLNLYGIDENGDEVMFTKDHIIPKSKGGSNKLENYQVLCAKCNVEKGDKI